MSIRRIITPSDAPDMAGTLAKENGVGIVALGNNNHCHANTGSCHLFKHLHSILSVACCC